MEKKEETREKVSFVIKADACSAAGCYPSIIAPSYGRPHLGLPKAGSVRVVPREQKLTIIEGDRVCAFRKDVRNRV